MADYIIKGETLTGIADAIRRKTGGTEPINPTDMPGQIDGIPGGDASLPAGVYWERESFNPVNNYLQTWIWDNGKIYAFALGYSGNGNDPTCYKLENGAWVQTIASQNWNTSSPNQWGVIKHNGKFHVFNTASTTKAHYTMSSFDPGGVRSIMADLPNYSQGMFVLNGILYCVSYGKMYAWDEATDTWGQGVTLSYSNVEPIAVNDDLYFHTNNGKIIYKYNNGTLEEVFTTTYGLSRERVFSVNGCIYWYSGSSTVPYVLWKYDPSTETETMVGYGPRLVGTIQFLVADNNAMLIVGGNDGKDVYIMREVIG